MTRFQIADPARRLPPLGPDAIHVWRLPMPREEGRDGIRRLLAAYLDTDPVHLHFLAGPHGRPSLAPPHDHLDANWSHCDGVGMVAIARSLPLLGIDFERHRPRPRALQLARRYFHPEESRQLAGLPTECIEPAFLRLWTAKESVLKALGEGLRFGLHRLQFRLADSNLSIAAFASEAGDAAHWHLVRRDDARGLTCLAWRGGHRRVEWFEYPVC